MKHYQVDEFIHDEHNLCTPYTGNKNNIIDKKVSLLYDFCILTKSDKRETSVRNVLAKYNTEAEMTRALHNVLVGKCTLDKFIGGNI